MIEPPVDWTGESAPGWPGIDPRWTSSAKSGVGTAADRASQIWFSISHGILNEVYYPRIDQACTRDMGLVVTADGGFFSEEKRDATSTIEHFEEGAPAFRLTNICKLGRYRIVKEIVVDPRFDAVLERTRFLPLSGSLKDYRVHVLLAPHLGNRGSGNTGWVGDYKGEPMLLAARGPCALALCASVPWKRRSVGYVGISDGWQDLHQHGRLEWAYTHAPDGNIALVGEVDLESSGGEFLLVLGFGLNWAEAGNRARAALAEGFDRACELYLRGWREWHAGLLDLSGEDETTKRLARISAAVLRAHNAKRFSGGTIASLSIPWGFHKGDDDLGGYHLVWPRDLVETAGGLLAAGAVADAGDILRYLQSTQEPDGHWPQNMWLDGTPYWGGVQMDEAAFPILLVNGMRRLGALDESQLAGLWRMVRRAAAFVAANGPITAQDRWEENSGFTPFTLAVEITALLAAAELADLAGEGRLASYLRETADFWNDSIEDWLYVSGTDLARAAGVEGYYIRIAPTDEYGDSAPTQIVAVKNSLRGLDVPADHLVSQDALALVRFALRDAKDPRILNTVRVIDRLLKVDTPVGPCWRRYNFDGYGEHEDGSPFDGSGVGRAWPLLTGERAHYELAAGNRAEAERLAETLAAFANEGGMIPEQVWDADDLPERELFRGKPTGSAMPLVWAHSEYLKLLRSLRDGRVFDMPILTHERYIVQKTRPTHSAWRFNLRIPRMPVGRKLRIELLAPALVHWSANEWHDAADAGTEDAEIGVHFVDLPTEKMPAGTEVSFTFLWTESGRWENQNFRVRIV